MVRILLFIFLNFLFACNSVYADDLEVSKYPEVRQYLTSSFNKLQDASSIKNNKILSTILEKNLDFTNITKAVLGRFGMDLGEEKMQRFQSLYKEYLIKVYIEKLQLINLEGGVLAIEHVRQDKKNKNMFMIGAHFTDKENTMINIDSVVTKEIDEYMIFDIVVESFSVMTSHRLAFEHSIEKNGGIDVLLEQLEKKIKD